MKKLAGLLLLALLPALASFSASPGATAAWTVTTEAAPWKNAGPLPLAKAEGVDFDVQIDPAAARQTIDGFGGAFNEKGWVALSSLDAKNRDETLSALFDPKEGAKLGICRVPIGASDYAVDRYTLDEVKDDYGMGSFSIDRDRRYLIPYIKAAMKLRPDLKIWGSVWTPPTWMKTNGAFDGGSMKDDPKVYDAFALYLARFLEAYQGEGVDAFAVCVQNEPLIETNYPSCLWTPKQFLSFIRDHLGPLFAARGVRGEIWLGTLQDADYTAFPQTVLDDPKANAFISAVGFQWDGYYSVAPTRSNHPSKKIVQTETECGNWYWKAGFDPQKPQNDWKYGSYTWGKVRDFFNQGVNSYTLWNMVLDQEGKSIDSQRPWPQNAAIVVDTRSKSVIYTPMYYAFKHYSYFVLPGATLLKAGFSGFWKDAIAFKNPDGKVVLVLQNSAAAEKPVKIKVADKALTLDLPARSWSTVVMP